MIFDRDLKNRFPIYIVSRLNEAGKVDKLFLTRQVKLKV